MDTPVEKPPVALFKVEVERADDAVLVSVFPVKGGRRQFLLPLRLVEGLAESLVKQAKGAAEPNADARMTPPKD